MPKTSAKDTTILINGLNLSTYYTSLEVENSINPVEVTGFGDGVRNYIPSIKSGSIKGNVLWDSAASKTHTLLRALTSTGYVTVIPGTYSLGADSISMPYMQGNYMPKGAPDAAIQVGNIVFENYGTTSQGVELGWALQNGTITTTTTGTGFPDPSGAAVTSACSATLHIWRATATDTYVVKVQHGTTLGGAYADLITFTANGTSVTAERQAVASGTVNAFRRILATRTGAAGDTFGFTVHFAH